MKTVPLHGAKAAGRVALVDDEDYDLVMQYRWYVFERVRAAGRTDGPYAIATPWIDGRSVTLKMHKLITGWPRTDHEDHNGLNNQRSNLRPATVAQNNHNQLPYLGRTSPYKGIYWDKQNRKWRAQIGGSGSKRYLGLFASEEDAARAYDAAAREAWGEFACLNFPEGAEAARSA